MLSPLLLWPISLAALASPIGPTPQDPRTEGLPVFRFPGNEERATLLTNFLREHFETRRWNYRTLFNKEYLTLADLWMAGAVDPRRERPVQELYAEGLLETKMDDEGYVSSHQHFSHAHDDGWPFPLWPQTLGGYAGKTYGWHFQDEGRGWLWKFGWLTAESPNTGVRATAGWQLEGLQDQGIRADVWSLKVVEENVALTVPPGVRLDASCSPFLQIRWSLKGGDAEGVRARIEWLREGDEHFDQERSMPFEGPGASKSDWTGLSHALIPLHRHAEWQGGIERFRIVLENVAPGAELTIDSVFTAYDTRHAINDPIFLLASWNVFRWTGDLEFLRGNLNRMRRALRYQQTVMGGLEHNRIRNTWPGHDGLAGWILNEDGSKQPRPGHGIGNNYFDLMPFGWDDCYSTAQYHACLLVMAELEEAIAAHTEWKLPPGVPAFDPKALRGHAAEVSRVANDLFWNEGTGRFVACIDREGVAHDYGYSFLNLDAIHYGLASPEHGAQILDWLSGDRIVASDTSQGADIYRWRFGPRVSTLRNVEWYGQAWTAPESIPFGGQIQDGGAVLGFAYFDQSARLRVRGPDDAWERLCGLLEWEAEVRAAGGYRDYYADGSQGTTLQGCGTAGGIGIDCEFHETRLVPSIIVYGFLGLDPGADRLRIQPRLPATCPVMAVEGLLYRGVRMDVRASREELTLVLHDTPTTPLVIELPTGWRRTGEPGGPRVFRIGSAGEVGFEVVR